MPATIWSNIGANHGKLSYCEYKTSHRPPSKCIKLGSMHAGVHEDIPCVPLDHGALNLQSRLTGTAIVAFVCKWLNLVIVATVLWISLSDYGERGDSAWRLPVGKAGPRRRLILDAEADRGVVGVGNTKWLLLYVYPRVIFRVQ